MIETNKPNLAMAVVSIAVTVFLAGCTTPNPRDEDIPFSYTEEDTLKAFRGLGYDYDPLRSPDELATLSKLIISGNVSGVREGRTRSFPSNTEIKAPTTIILVVNNVDSVRGELPSENDGNVYIELPNPGQKDTTAYESAFPVGGAVVAFMVPAADGQLREGTDMGLESPGAGRPDGQALYFPANPQGVAIQVGEEDVVWPLIGVQKPGKVADTLPGGNLIAE